MDAYVHVHIHVNVHVQGNPILVIGAENNCPRVSPLNDLISPPEILRWKLTLPLLLSVRVCVSGWIIQSIFVKGPKVQIIISDTNHIST